MKKNERNENEVKNGKWGGERSKKDDGEKSEGKKVKRKKRKMKEKKEG